VNNLDELEKLQKEVGGLSEEQS